MNMTPRLTINIRETVHDSGEYEFRVRNIWDRRMENIRFYYGRVLGPSCWYDDTHLGFSDNDIEPMLIPSLDPEEEFTLVTRLWGTLREYIKNNSRPVWSKIIAVSVTVKVSDKPSPVDGSVYASVTIEKPTYVTFTYGEGSGDK